MKIREINKIINEQVAMFENTAEIQKMMADQDKVNSIIIRLKEYIDKTERKVGFSQIIDVSDFHKMID